ncbi:alpha/beta fold hydrolase [Stieleria varia]|uniref:Alpha/beta hydrolase family protein n=1 Tax=Stieleria varia TaxID=2528005 RepID=A0A5C6B1J3_9BACT|nr:alpha/beta hydrolase [Stieleria varia]TWU05758.1 Alpha/beta hydrolase family protein [Stieleria varia]
MLRLLHTVVITGCLCMTVIAQDKAADLAATMGRHVTDVKTESFHEFKMLVGEFDGVTCRIVQPMTAAPGNPWVWRARFWGHQPAFDLAMLRRGWHVAYCDVADLFGSDQAVRRWNDFYKLTTQMGLSDKPLLEGMSRGGLIVMRWASANPTKVSGIYVDNAVMDFRSWPGGKGTGPGAAPSWQKCLAAYGMTDAQSETYDSGPLDRLEPLAKAGVPIYALINEADEVVPPAENGDILVQRYQKLGGKITQHRRPGLGHHPHGLTDPTPIVNFALESFSITSDR